MSDESKVISSRTWERAANIINKIGYMDGASGGQTATFQSSFDIGYEQGFSFGLQLGLKDAKHRLEQTSQTFRELTDPRRINCQICLNNANAQDSVANLYNVQKENNDEYLTETSKENMNN